MSISTQIIDAKWFTQGKNGDDFSLAGTDFSRNLIAGIFENVKLVATVKTFTSVTIENYYIGDDYISLESGTFTEGLSLGDTCRLVFQGNNTIDFTMELTSISDNIIYFNKLTDTSGNVYPKPLVGPDRIIVESDLTYLRYNHGLRSSIVSEEFYRSYLDDQTLSYFVSDIGLRTPTPSDPRGTTFSDGLKTAINGHTGSFKARYVQNSDIPLDNVGTFQSAQEYEIEHIFKVQDYSVNDIQDYIDNIRPDNYLGQSTLDYNSQFEFRTVETNPSTSKVGTYISTGSVGYFNENLNGGLNRYSISGLNIVRDSTGETVDQLTSGESCTVTFTINSTETPFTIDPVIVLNHFAMVEDYEQKDIDFNDLFKADEVRLEGVSSDTGTYITSAEILSYTNNSISVSMVINPNDLTLEGVNYKLSVLVADPNLTNENTDKVTLSIQSSTYSDQFDIEGLIGTPTLEIFTRDCDPYTDSGFTSMEIINAELLNTKFSLPVLDGEINKIEIVTVSSKSGENYIIDRRDIDTSSFQVIGGVQRIDAVLPNPYSLGIDGSIKWISGTDYEIVYPYRLPFDKENFVSGLPDDLYDTNEPNNGHNESVFYQQGLGYTIHIGYLIGMLKNGIVTDYLYKSPTLTIKDFEQTL